MKWWIVALIATPFFYFAPPTCGHFFVKKLVKETDLNGSLNKLMQEKIIEKIPKNREVFVCEFPSMAPWHRMTGKLPYYIQVPSIKTTDLQVAFDESLPYLQAYVDAMNNVPEVRPFLIEFPMNLRMFDFTIGFAEDEKTHLPLYVPYVASLLFCGRELELNGFFESRIRADGLEIHNTYYNLYDTSKGIPEALKNMEIPRFDKEKKKVEISRVEWFAGLNESYKPCFVYLRDFARRHNLFFIAYESILRAAVDEKGLAAAR